MNLSIVPPALEDQVGDQLEALVQEADHVVRVHALGEARELPDVDEQDRHLALDAGLLLVRCRSRAAGSARSRRRSGRTPAGSCCFCSSESPISLNARVSSPTSSREVGGTRTVTSPAASRSTPHAQPAQRPDQQRHEAEPREHADHHHHHGDRGELLRVARDHRVDEQAQVELDLRLADQHVAVDHGRGDAQPAAVAAHPDAVRAPRGARRGSRAAGRAGPDRATRARARRGRAAAPPPRPRGCRRPGSACRARARARTRRARLEQRLLGRAREVRGQRAAALLDLGLERTALVPRGEHRESHASRRRARRRRAR